MINPLSGKDTEGGADLFNTNASIVRDLAKAVADSAPEANTLVISNPVCHPIDLSFHI